MKKEIISTIALFGIVTSAIYAMNSEDISIVNRQWIDHMPTSDKELASIWVLVGDEDGMGAKAEISQWRQHIDMFFWEGNETIHASFPQDESQVVFSNIKAYECDVPPFELCLEMEVDNTMKKFYSRWDWEVDSLNKVGEMIINENI